MPAHDGNERGLAAADTPLTARVTRDATSVVISVEDTITDLLGWRPDELVGRPAVEFIHPEDLPGTIAAFFALREAPGTTTVWVARFRAADGGWRWIHSENVNCLDDPDNPAMVSTLTAVSGDRVTLEEELQARKQVLNRLSDALPVGVVQIDAKCAITFTNDRLHAILGNAPAATAEAQFATVIAEDQSLVATALSMALAGKPVGDLEIRIAEDRSDGAAGGRVCVLSLRSLTGSSGLVSGAIGCLTDVTESVRLRHQLEVRASVDDLTSCLNRGATLELIAATLLHDHEQRRGTAIVFIDLDRFKPINDCFGHLAGDRLLAAAAERLRRAVREHDKVGRVGGDEFLVVCPAVDSPTEALEIGERVSRAMTASIDLGLGAVDLRASVGVAWTRECLDADTLVAQADTAMYEAKRAHQSDPSLFDASEICAAG